MKTVLILALACNRSPFREMMIAQMRTWDSLFEEGVSTVFYSGDSESVQWDGNWLKVPAPDNYHCIGWKTKVALEEALKTPWDYLFRTNSSSYVCKKRLIEFVQNLPVTGYYGGVHNYGKHPPVWASGAGIILSRDVASIVQSQLKPLKNLVEVDDMEIGHICHNSGISCDGTMPMFSWDLEGAYRETDDFHFRCRPEHDRRDGSHESEAFGVIFENRKRLYK